MTGLGIDTDLAERTAASWIARGDAWFAAGTGFERERAALELGDIGGLATHELLAASAEAWVNASFLRLVVDRVLAGDVLTDADVVRRLRARSGATVQMSLGEACAPWAAWSFSPLGGDLGETFDAEVRSPYTVAGTTPAARGRDLVARALTDTGDQLQIRADELELVRLASGRFLLVLPGVTDLSRPDLGLSEQHRSVRDVDRHAYPSSRSTAVADNRYAQMVADAMRAAGVPTGAEVMIVGHSFGADTALDLAADAAFNGPDGFAVTHVVAAGYHSGPQLAAVSHGTEVLVLQNRRDAAVIVEAVGHGHVTEGIEARRSLFSDLWRGDLLGAAGSFGASVVHDVGAVADLATHLARHGDDLADVGFGLVTGDLARAGDGAADLVTLTPGVRTPTDHQVVAVFEGGARGGGHDPANYVDEVLATQHPAVLAFFESIDRAGFATDGAAVAIDVSVP